VSILKEKSPLRKKKKKVKRLDSTLKRLDAELSPMREKKIFSESKIGEA